MPATATAGPPMRAGGRPMPDPRIALYPGTFDPITNGHLDIIRRAVRLVDHLIIAVARNAGKNPLLGVDERLELVRAEIADLRLPAGGCRVEARSFDTLLMHFAQSVGANMIVRGLRAVSDFEYEFQMAGMNTRLNPDVETVFLMASEQHQFIASRFVKEIGRLGGDISSFVSPRVAQRLVARFHEERGDVNHAQARVQTLEDS
jgi:pantetheine-phosphate adenylyltransferase